MSILQRFGALLYKVFEVVSGWTGKASGVDSTNIAKIMGVAIADIAKVGGV